MGDEFGFGRTVEWEGVPVHDPEMRRKLLTLMVANRRFIVTERMEQYYDTCVQCGASIDATCYCAVG